MAPYQQYLLNTGLGAGTPLVQAEDNHGDFLLGDFDGDGIPDLYFIKRRNTGSKMIEVHVLSGQSNYGKFIEHHGTALVQAEDSNGSFALGYNVGDGVSDLYFIKRRNTGSKMIEVHVLTGRSQFANRTGHVTSLVQAEDNNGDFLVGDFDRDGIPDLFFIKRRNTGSKTIEVHVLSGSSQYKNFILHHGTSLVQAEDNNGDYALADLDRDGVSDLYFIKKRNTGTKTIEVHVLSGRSQYMNFIQHAGTAFSAGSALNGDFPIADFDRDGIPDLYFIERRPVGIKSIEVEILAGSG